MLEALAQVWRERRDEALETAASVMAAIEHNESFSGRGGELTLALVDKIAASDCEPVRPAQRRLRLAAQISSSRPRLTCCWKWPRTAATTQAGVAFAVTLEKMARGGVYDQLAGGFHRYSVDEHWGVPHFEKMLYDNTELLRNYLHGFQSFVREDFRATAREIVGWLDATMTDRDRGGFYASQDADINLDDDGDYFTWTLAEAREALHAADLSEGDIEIALRYWDLREARRHAPQPGQKRSSCEAAPSRS